MSRPRWILSLALAALSVVAGAQERLTLQDALAMASSRNGTVAAARKQVDAARARANQARAAFYPTITPALNYLDTRRDFLTGNPGGGSQTINSSGLTTDVSLNWQVLDSGERRLDFLAARRGLDAQNFESLQTLRETLFLVYAQYFDVIRTRQLVNDATAQVDRAQKTYDQALRQFQVGDLAEKDTHQPRADLLNAKVFKLEAENRRNVAEAEFKATIGWDNRQPLPPIDAPGEPPKVDPGDLNELIDTGLENRADLLGQRRRLDQQSLGLELTKRLSGIRWSLDVGFVKQFGQDNVNNRTLSLSASYPLFDGGRVREQVREGEALLDASRFGLTQQERTVRSEIESVYRELLLNGERVDAAKVALEAARINYEKVSRAQELGAEGADVVAVSTAQVTLVQAETNYVEAIYDYYISQARLDLVVGRPVPGETPQDSR
jgi:outer membrane protein